MIKYNGKYVYVGNPHVHDITKPMWGTVGNLVLTESCGDQYWLDVNEDIAYKVERNEVIEFNEFKFRVMDILKNKKLYWEFYDEKVEIDHFDIALPFVDVTVGNYDYEYGDPYDEESVMFWLAEHDGESYQIVTTTNTSYALYVIRIQTEGCRISQLLIEYLYDCFLTFGEECDTL